MDDSSSGPFIIGLMFILRCLIPLGILFGISYLLQRLGLVTDRVDDENADEMVAPRIQALKEVNRPTNVSSTSASGSPGQVGKQTSKAPQKRSRTK